MKDFTKKDLMMIINTYQNYMNDFGNITDEDLDQIYFDIAKNDFTNYIMETKAEMVFDRESDKSDNRMGLSQQEFDEFVKDYSPENTNGYNRKSYIVRDYIKYPYNLHQQHNDKLNSFDDEKDLVWYIINNKLTKQVRTI
tara:strand:+ start:277 stop:696 length:420 start_codon:yes stop_codon:yes gene_type:complete